MGNRFFQFFVAAFNRIFGSAFSRIRNLFQLRRIINSIYSKIVQGIASVLNVKPRDKDDYYTVFGWMVSKKLAYAVVILIGSISVMLLWKLYGDNMVSSMENGVKTYKYDSMLLKLAKGNVRILGQGGYLAYEGNVKDGCAAGNGNLYGVDGNLVYTGEFAKSKYNGKGSFYYPSGVLKYKGDFTDNLYEGVGSLYRENGTLLYTGDFSEGLKEGTGVLYGNSGSTLFTGEFHYDYPAYSSFLNKQSADAAEAYTGSRELYDNEDEQAVLLKELSVFYSMSSEENKALEDGTTIKAVYVLQQGYPTAEGMAKDFYALDRHFGVPIYEGSSYINMKEALAMTLVRDKTGDANYTESPAELIYEYDDYYHVAESDMNKLVYLRAYESDGLMYTFVGDRTEDGFGFYYITSKENEETEEDISE